MATKVKFNDDVKVNKVTPRALAYVDANKLVMTNKLYDELASIDKAFASLPYGYKVQFLSELKASELLDAMKDDARLVTWDVKKLEHGVYNISFDITPNKPKASKPRASKPKAKSSK